MSQYTRELADMYRAHVWPAIVTSTDRTRRVRGVIVGVSAETMTVLTADGGVETFRHGDVLEIYPAGNADA